MRHRRHCSFETKAPDNSIQQALLPEASATVSPLLPCVLKWGFNLHRAAPRLHLHLARGNSHAQNRFGTYGRGAANKAESVEWSCVSATDIACLALQASMSRATLCSLASASIVKPKLRWRANHSTGNGRCKEAVLALLALCNLHLHQHSSAA